MGTTNNCELNAYKAGKIKMLTDFGVRVTNEIRSAIENAVNDMEADRLCKKYITEFLNSCL